MGPRIHELDHEILKGFLARFDLEAVYLVLIEWSVRLSVGFKGKKLLGLARMDFGEYLGG